MLRKVRDGGSNFLFSTLSTFATRVAFASEGSFPMNSDLDIKQDFETAMLKHLLFKSKLRSFLYGSALAEGPARDPDQCSLGVWIAQRWQSPWGRLPEWSALDRAHRQVHAQANDLMDMYLQGFHEQAREGLADLLPLTDQITRLLQTIQDKLRTPG
jgi:hypothetical protein